MSSQQDQDEIRKRLSAFAATIPDHGLNAFGQLVQIKAVRCDCVYRVTLETDYEGRTLLKREKPDDGSVAGATEHAAVGPEVDVWDATWDSLVSNKQPGDYEYGIPGSIKTGRCRPCRGRGALQCETCDGQGKLTCSRCQGGWEWCGGCSGKGVRWEKRLGRRKRECFNSTHGPWCCNGKGWEYVPHEETYEETCRRCGGKGQHKCTRCNGTTTVNCEKCRGGGRLVCPTCQGRKRVVSWLAIRQSIHRLTENVRCGSTGLTEEDRRHLAPAASGKADDLDQSDFDLVLRFDVQPPGSDRLPSELEHCALPSELRASVDGLLAAAIGKAGQSKRITRQSLRIEEARVLAVTYSYAGKEYRCKLVGKSNVLAQVSPLSELTDLRKGLAASRKKLRTANWVEWLHASLPGKVLFGAFFACPLVGWVVLLVAAVIIKLSGWQGIQSSDHRATLGGVLFFCWLLSFIPFSIISALCYRYFADKAKLQHRLDRLNEPVLTEIRVVETEVERLLQPARDRLDKELDAHERRKQDAIAELLAYLSDPQREDESPQMVTQEIQRRLQDLHGQKEALKPRLQQLIEKIGQKPRFNKHDGVVILLVGDFLEEDDISVP